MNLLQTEIEQLVQIALAEDLPWGDVTSETLLEPEWQAQGTVIAKGEGVIAGLPIMACVFQMVDPMTCFETLCRDGTAVQYGDIVARVEGSAISLLRAERIALNFLQQLSGVATLTAQLVAQISDLPAHIIDTRKTIPGLRRLQKYAVRMGGGNNHRFSLSDGVLIKDNHLALLRQNNKSMKDALTAMRYRIPHGIKIEIEVETFAELHDALHAGAEIILLDNMSPERLREAVAIVDGCAITQASGGITLDTVRAVAESGVDLISVGALTHSAKALDLSFEMIS